ncbi:MAG: hypothetical protein K6F86_01885 [Lachnospiraceae bacterium]|nr:hypothetical protein [Lachnospiraceae bacterium]
MAKDKQGNTIELPEWVALIMVLVMVSVVFMKPSYIYWENKERMSTLSSCSSSPCVFITDNRNPSITSELQNLLLFDDIFVTDLESCDGVEKYIESHGANMKTVVFIATYPKKKNDENILNCISDIADYKEKQSLYQGDFANVYELYK